LDCAERRPSVTLKQILFLAVALTRSTVLDRESHWVALPGPPKPLPPHASVTIIGGGVMGVSTAWHLARAGIGSILVIERNLMGSGSSAKPLGGVRATFSDPGNILLAQRSLEAFERFGAEFGVDIGLRQVGYLFLCRTEKELAAVESSTELQNRLGGSSQMVSPGQAAQLNPFIDPSVLLGASFSPRDGYAEPGQVVRGYADAARKMGVVFSEQTEVTAMDTWDGTVTAVRTSHGLVRTEAVICTAGAWSQRIGEMVGVLLPVVPVRRQIGFTGPLMQRMPTVPFTLDLGSTLYFHNAGDGLLLGISDPDQRPGFGREFTYEWLAAFDKAASVVAPSLVGARLEAGWAGLYENTPDHNALIGKAHTPRNFLYATGFSGHDFLQAPAVGQLVTDLFLERDSFMDPHPFRADRFRAAEALSEVHII
jgi:sarcosine oxidase, subunit beta